MIGAQESNLKSENAVKLPIQARSLLLEIALDGATSVQLQTSGDNNTWHNVGAAITADSLTSYDDGSEHFLVYVRVVISGTMGANGKANLFYGVE